MIETRLQGLDAALKALDEKQVERAHVRATNRALTKGRTEWSRGIRKDYVIKAGDITKRSRLRRLKRMGQDAGIELSSPVISLRDFGAKQTRKGVSVRIRRGGGRRVVAGAFIVDSLGGHVFRRKGDARLPIDKLMTLSVPQMADDAAVIELATDAVGAEYTKEFGRLIELFGSAL